MNVDGATFLAMVQAKVFPAIQAAYYSAKRSIDIQMDGAKPHVAGNVQEELEVECLKDGYHQMKIQVQPPQSSDPNIVDLGLFHSL